MSDLSPDIQLLEREYHKIKENELIYKEKIKNWNRVSEFFSYIFVLLLIIYFVCMGVDIIGMVFFNVNLINIETGDALFYSILITMIILIIIISLLGKKINKIDRDLKITDNEYLFIQTMDIYYNISLFNDQTVLARKKYYNKIAVENIHKLISIINGWSYGDLILTKKILGDKLDLLKNNFNRLVYTNLIIGNESEFPQIKNILLFFASYLLNPSLDKLDNINTEMNKLTYKEYQEKTSLETVKKYFTSNPLKSRIIFTFIVVAIIFFISFYLHFETHIIFTVVITSIWGAFSAFDKFFPNKT